MAGKETTELSWGQIISSTFKNAAHVVFTSFVGGLATMLLWNLAVPDLFGLPSIEYLQSVALTGLCSVLFQSSSILKK